MTTLSSSRLLVGGDSNPKNLHAYGDKDGVETEAKLQHPLGVHFIPEKNVILATDTYNHKLQVIDPFRNEIFSWLGSGQVFTMKRSVTLRSIFVIPTIIALGKFTTISVQSPLQRSAVFPFAWMENAAQKT